MLSVCQSCVDQREMLVAQRSQNHNVLGNIFESGTRLVCVLIGAELDVISDKTLKINI